MIIMRRLELKNPSAHLTDELRNDLLKKKWHLASQRVSTLCLCFSHPIPPFLMSFFVFLSPSLSVSHIQCQAFSVSFLKSGRPVKWHASRHTSIQCIAHILYTRAVTGNYFSLTHTCRVQHAHKPFIDTWEETRSTCPLPLLRTPRPCDFTKGEKIAPQQIHKNTHAVCCFILWSDCRGAASN